MARSLAIFGSCVTRDAFEARPPCATDSDRIALYLSRTTINSCLVEPVAFAGLSPRVANAKFEERCVASDLGKTHFDELRRAGCDYLLLDLIDERHAIVKIGGSYACHSVPFARLAEAHAIDIATYERLLPSDPAIVRRTLDNIPRFIERIQAIVDPGRIVLHEARWATHFRAVDGTVQAFKQQNYIGESNRILELYYDRLKAACPGMKTIRVPADHVLGDEAHRWTLEPFHYTDAYYVQFLDRLAAVTAGDGPRRLAAESCPPLPPSTAGAAGPSAVATPLSLKVPGLVD